MSCRFYGFNGMFGTLMPTGGNQCALIRTSHSPCPRKMAGEPVEERDCPVVHEVALCTAPGDYEGWADPDVAEALVRARRLPVL